MERYIPLNSKDHSATQQVTKIARLGRQEPQPTGTTKWATTLRFWKILGTTSVVRSIQIPQNVVRCKIHRP